MTNINTVITISSVSLVGCDDVMQFKKITEWHREAAKLSRDVEQADLYGDKHNLKIALF